MEEILLREVAYSRSGDKGDTSNIGVIPYRESDYAWLLEELTVERVRDMFGELVRGGVTRYELPGIKALNFVLEEALSGGVSRSLNLDAHGKSWGNLILRVVVNAPPGWTPYWPTLYPPLGEGLE